MFGNNNNKTNTKATSTNSMNGTGSKGINTLVSGTRIEGTIIDQSALLGILVTLQELHLPIVSVWRANKPNVS